MPPRSNITGLSKDDNAICVDLILVALESL